MPLDHIYLTLFGNLGFQLFLWGIGSIRNWYRILGEKLRRTWWISWLCFSRPHKYNGTRLSDSDSIFIARVNVIFFDFVAKHMLLTKTYVPCVSFHPPSNLPSHATCPPTPTTPPTLQPRSSHSNNIKNMFFRVAKYGRRFNPQIKWKAIAG